MKRKFDVKESERVAEMIRRLPLPEVRKQTGWSYHTLCRIAEIMA